MSRKDLFGKYYVFKYRTKVQAHEYILDLFEQEGTLNFNLKKIISGNFGSVGLEWLGTCSIINNIITFNQTQVVDWRYTFLDDERQDIISSSSKTYEAMIIREDFNIRLDIKMEVLKLSMYMVDDKINHFTNLISYRIITDYDLDAKVEKINEPGIYWRISNLVLKNPERNEESGESFKELNCEFDIDIVKEEKRVINSDEVLRERQVVKVRFNDKNELVLFERMQ